MRVNTNELIGHALDWAVAKCEGEEAELNRGEVVTWKTVALHEYRLVWEPSTNWAQGGAIIEREKMGLRCGDGTWGVAEDKWEASHPECLYVKHGATPLIAAMRCYVASKLGDEVEVPDELIQEVTND